MRSLMVASLISLTPLANDAAAGGPANAPATIGIDGVSLSDASVEGTFNLSVAQDSALRYVSAAPSWRGAPIEVQEANNDDRQYEMSLAAHSVAGLPLDVGVAQSGSVGVDPSGDIGHIGRGSEFRVGRGIEMAEPGSSWNNPTFYMFAASDNDALMWSPGERTTFQGPQANLALQDRMNIGDRRAGVTYALGGLEASLAYVERRFDAHTGLRVVSQEQHFTGLTLTMRR